MDVIKEAREIPGFFPLWRKDERVWLEIRPEQLDKPFFFGNSIASGIGTTFLWPGLMGREQIVEFRRVGNNVQLMARNLRVRAPEGTPLARALSESYSDSLLASTPVVSSAHPERKSFLVDAAALMSADFYGLQTTVDAQFRMNFAIDRGNSGIERAASTANGTFITYRTHFAVPKLPAPPVQAPGAPPPNPAALPNPPRVVPDPRSFFVSIAYTFAPLPAEPMRPRLADQRVGHFTTSFLDLANESGSDALTHFVERWRLDKKDPAAAVSDVKEPIRVVIDRNVPEKYRATMRDAALEWNKAFERAGLRNAIAVEQQPRDADWSTYDGVRMLAVRWFVQEGPGATAVGPSQSDPRTGEILRGVAIIPENWARLDRARLAERWPRPVGAGSLDELLGRQQCTLAYDALDQVDFALAVMIERGDLVAGSPGAEKFIADNLKWVTMHEIGHALGLRHNFKASTAVKLEQLRDSAWVRANGLAPSVMDYVPVNTPLDGEPVGEVAQTTIGAYDYWAIEYAYRPFAADAEPAGLAEIAGRQARDPMLSYATDEDAGFGPIAGLDPTVNRFDLGADPLAFYERQFRLVRELWARTQKRPIGPNENYAVFRRNLTRGLMTFQFTTPDIARYIGGVYTSRDVGPDARPAMTPVPAAEQRRALDLLTREVFSSSSFRFDPGFLSRLGVDHLDRTTGTDFAAAVNTDFSVGTRVLGIHRSALDALMNDGLAARLADSETKLADPRQALTYADVQATLTRAIWSELAAGGDIDPLRRNLQREHLRRLTAGLLRPSAGVAADVRAVVRQVAAGLRDDLRRASASPKLNAMSRAHLADMQAQLTEALSATVTKQGG